MTQINSKLKAVQEFLSELAWAARTIPGEVVAQWRAAHRWSRDTGDFIFVADGKHHTAVWVSDPDYLMWRRLGWITDFLVVCIAAITVFLVGVALAYVVA